MSSMKDREEGFERKFAFDEELRFKASARRNKALGLWADHIKVILAQARGANVHRLKRL